MILWESDFRLFIMSQSIADFVCPVQGSSICFLSNSVKQTLGEVSGLSILSICYGTEQSVLSINLILPSSHITANSAEWDYLVHMFYISNLCGGG